MGNLLIWWVFFIIILDNTLCRPQSSLLHNSSSGGAVVHFYSFMWKNDPLYYINTCRRLQTNGIVLQRQEHWPEKRSEMIRCFLCPHHHHMYIEMNIVLSKYFFFPSINLICIFVQFHSWLWPYYLLHHLCCTNNTYLEKCSVLSCRVILKGLHCPKNGDRSFALNPSCTGPSLRDHLVKFFYRLPHVPVQANQGNLPPSIKTALSVSVKTVWGRNLSLH